MSDSNEQQNKEGERPAKPPLPRGEKFYDPWDEEFRRSYSNKTFEF